MACRVIYTTSQSFSVLARHFTSPGVGADIKTNPTTVAPSHMMTFKCRFCGFTSKKEFVTLPIQAHQGPMAKTFPSNIAKQSRRKMCVELSCSVSSLLTHTHTLGTLWRQLPTRCFLSWNISGQRVAKVSQYSDSHSLALVLSLRVHKANSNSHLPFYFLDKLPKFWKSKS